MRRIWLNLEQNRRARTSHQRRMATKRRKLNGLLRTFGSSWPSRCLARADIVLSRGKCKVGRPICQLVVTVRRLGSDRTPAWEALGRRDDLGRADRSLES